MAAMASVRAEKCCYLVGAHTVTPRPPGASARQLPTTMQFCLQFLIYSTLVLDEFKRSRHPS